MKTINNYAYPKHAVRYNHALRECIWVSHHSLPNVEEYDINSLKIDNIE